ncbi:helix-turn-helix transcriptional regulator [Labrys miyagiensis]
MYLTTKEAAKFLGISHKTLEKWRSLGTDGAPPYIRLRNRVIRYNREDLLQYLEKLKHK